MVDTLLHHYQRLWKAEATPEILNTRKPLPQKPAGMRSAGSLSNLYRSPYLPNFNHKRPPSKKVRL